VYSEKSIMLSCRSPFICRFIFPSYIIWTWFAVMQILFNQTQPTLGLDDSVLIYTGHLMTLYQLQSFCDM
jgi:hypothetical protein